MSKSKVLRSVLAFLLVLASLVSLVPAVFAEENEDRQQITINASDLVAAYDEEELARQEAEGKAEEYEESVLQALCEEYGLDYEEETESSEYGYFTEEDLKELGLEEQKANTKDVRNADYVFLDFNVGSASREMNWQIKSDYTTESNRLYYSQNKQGFICAQFKGNDGRLYMPIETAVDYIEDRMNGYTIRSGDICRIYIGSISENTLFPKNGTATADSYLAMHCSLAQGSWTKFGANTTITYKSGAQELTWKAYSSNVGAKVYGMRWDPSQSDLTTTTKIYVDYVYVGPAASAPVNVQYCNEDGSIMTHGGNWVGWGKKARAWSTGKTNTENGDGTQTIWGWSVYNKVNGSWTATGKFITDPSTYTCKEDTRFRLAQVTIRKETLNSKQTYNNGVSTEDDKYVLTVDGFDTAEMNLGGYGTPLDVAIVMDRSGSHGELVWDKTFGADAKADLTEYCEAKLSKAVDPGYYRATAFRQLKPDGVTGKGVSQYIYTMPMRYYNGQWQMQCLVSCSCNGSGSTASHQSYGIYRWNSTGAQPCSHVKWVTVEQGYDYFVTYAKNTGFTNMGGNVTYDNVKEKLVFRLGASRLGRTQSAVENFLEKLYNSSTNLAPGKTHTVSVIGYGRSVYMSGYPYANANGGYKTGNAYADASIKSQGLDYTTYEKILGVINDTYIDGATRTDAAFQVLSGTVSTIETEAGKSKTTATNTDYLPAKASGRKRVVILLTDGVPSSNLEFDTDVANAAVKASLVLKKDGVTVYTVGIMDGLDSTVQTIYNNKNDEAKMANDFLNAMSSRYKGAQVWNTGGTLTKGDYYFSDTAAGGSIATQMESIWGGNAPSLAISGLSGPGSLWLYEDYGREWKPDTAATVKIYGEAYVGSGKYSGTKVLIGEHQVTDHTKSQDFTGNGYILHYYYREADQSFAYALQWTDAKTAFLRETSLNAGSKAKALSGSLDTSKGYKVYMEMPIEVDRNNTLGGNNIQLTTSNSGCYQAKDSTDKEMGTKLYSYYQPNANVFCSVEGEAHDYFISLEDYVALLSGKGDTTAKSVLNDMLRMPDDLKPANDKGVSNLKYLSFDVQLKDPTGTVLYHQAAAQNATTLSKNVSNLDAVQANLVKDQMFTLVSKMTYSSHNTDDYGRAPYSDVNSTFYPTYYVPKFAVLDYGDDISVNMGLEGENSGRIDGITVDTTTNEYHYVNNGKLIDGNDSVSYTYNTLNIPKGATSTIVDRQIVLLPANVVAYDDILFKDAPAATVTTGVNTTMKYLSWDDEGKRVDIKQKLDNTAIYGGDTEYATTGDFHGSTKKVTVGERKTYDEDGKLLSKETDTAHTTFTFTGTGFEILSRTTDNSGVIVAEVFAGDKVPEDEIEAKDVLVASILCNTYLKGGDNKQVPVIRWDGDAYGTYTVRLIAYYHPAFALRSTKSAMSEAEVKELLGYGDSVDFTYIPSESTDGKRAIATSYDVYLDGVRIFNPVESSEQVDALYSLAGEAVSNFTNMQSVVVNDAGNWDGKGKVDGILYLSDRTDDPETEDDESQAGSNGTTSSDKEGFPLFMDGKITTDPVGDRTYYIGADGKRITDPASGAEIFSMWYMVAGEEEERYRYMAENPKGTEKEPYLFFSRAYVRELMGDAGIFYSSRYKSLGAKTEVQLATGSGIAFTVNSDTVYLSLKSENGQACTVEVYNGTGWDTVVTGLDSATEAFYDFSTYVREGGLILKNSGEGILSLVHIKTPVSATGNGEESVASVDREFAYRAAKAFETPVAETEVAGLKLSHSLNLQSNISINYIVAKSALEGYDFYELTAEVAGKTYEIGGVEKGNYVYFILEGLNAAMMNDNVRAQLKAYAGDEVYVSPVDDYSIATYAYTMMNREGVSQQVKSLCANLLRYGAATQIYTGYNADALADEEMTAEQMAYLRDLDSVEFGAPYTILDDVAAPSVTWQGRTLILDSTVAVKLMVHAPNVDAQDMELRVSYTGIDGTQKALTVAPTVQNAENGVYMFTIGAMDAAELRSVLTCQVFVKGEPASKTMLYSADSYGNNKTGDLLTLCKALFAYVDEARAFFG